MRKRQDVQANYVQNNYVQTNYVQNNYVQNNYLSNLGCYPKITRIGLFKTVVNHSDGCEL
jgi:hypothetical protein